MPYYDHGTAPAPERRGRYLLPGGKDPFAPGWDDQPDVDEASGAPDAGDKAVATQAREGLGGDARSARVGVEPSAASGAADGDDGAGVTQAMSNLLGELSQQMTLLAQLHPTQGQRSTSARTMPKALRPGSSRPRLALVPITSSSSDENRRPGTAPTLIKGAAHKPRLAHSTSALQLRAPAPRVRLSRTASTGVLVTLR